MESVRVVYISIPRDEAKNLAKGIVENRLAACVNILPKIESLLMWESKIHKDQVKFADMVAYVREHHPYELPEIIGMPLVAAFPDYIKYVKTETEK